MSSFILCRDGDFGHTLVPNLFLDNYMPEANGEYVKIYLYLLRCLESDNQELSIALIADKFEHTESDVSRALKYWEKMKLLTLEYDASKNLTGIRLTGEKAADGPVRRSPEAFKAPEPKDPEPQAPEAKAPEPQAAPRQTPKAQPVPAPRQESLKKAAFPKPVEPLTPEDARQLLFICEQYLGKTLSSREVAKILDLHDSLGFSPDLIDYLVEYCVSGGHKSIHYIEATALGWHQAGCTTVTEARRQACVYTPAYFKILKAFGITNRNPVEGESSCMNRWLKDYGFSLELILEACSRTMTAIHQPSFPYTDKILTEWKKRGVRTLQDLKGLDEERKTKGQAAKAFPEQNSSSSAPRRQAAPNRFRNFQEREYDFGELEKKLINQ